MKAEDCSSIAMVVDRSGITAALAAANVIPETPEEPNGWRAAIRLFEGEPRAEYLFAVTDGRLDAPEKCHAFFGLNGTELESALFRGLKQYVPEGALVMWAVHGSELTQAFVARKLNTPLSNWS
jgi:hypothetical protein